MDRPWKCCLTTRPPGPFIINCCLLAAAENILLFALPHMQCTQAPFWKGCSSSIILYLCYLENEWMLRSNKIGTLLLQSLGRYLCLWIWVIDSIVHPIISIYQFITETKLNLQSLNKVIIIRTNVLLPQI